MGKINVFDELKKDNRSGKEVDLMVYADALTVYHEASANIKRNGAVCSHPRTGSPIENPYLKVAEKQGAILAKFRSINGDRVSKLLKAEYEA